MGDMQKTCLITGAGRHNGKIMALRMAKAGYRVAIHHSGQDPESADQTLQMIRSQGGDGFLIVEDLSRPGAAGRLFDQVEEKMDHLDVFINNAGVTLGGPIEKLSEETFDKLVSIDYRAAVFCVQKAADFMIRTGTKGLIVIISSNHHERIFPGGALYGSTKEALCRFTKYAGLEYIRWGIHVNCLAPGWIDWEEEMGDRKFKQPDIENHQIPAHRFVKSSDLADWVTFMAGPSGASLVGQTINLDGGASLLGPGMADFGLDRQIEIGR